MEKCGEMEGLAGMIAGRTPSYFVYNSKYGPLASFYDVISYPNGSERCGSKLGFFMIENARLSSNEQRKAVLNVTEEIVRDMEMEEFRWDMPFREMVDMIEMKLFSKIGQSMELSVVFDSYPPPYKFDRDGISGFLKRRRI